MNFFFLNYQLQTFKPEAIFLLELQDWRRKISDEMPWRHNKR